MKKDMLKGSFTIEAALLFPMVLLILLSAIYLNALVHNRTYLQLSACEQSISGKEYPNPSLFAAKDISRSCSDGEDLRTVSYTAKTKGIWKIFDFDISVKAEYQKCDPVKFIRKYRALKSAIT